MAGNKKIEEYENENYYLLWWSDKRHFPYNCLGLSDEDNSVSRSDNFVNVNVFNSVKSPRVLSYSCVLHYFSTMPVDFNFILTFGLKPRAGGIKIATVYKRSIFQVEWLIATLILYFQVLFNLMVIFEHGGNNSKYRGWMPLKSFVGCLPQENSA